VAPHAVGLNPSGRHHGLKANSGIQRKSDGFQKCESCTRSPSNRRITEGKYESEQIKSQKQEGRKEKEKETESIGYVAMVGRIPGNEATNVGTPQTPTDNTTQKTKVIEKVRKLLVMYAKLNRTHQLLHNLLRLEAAVYSYAIDDSSMYFGVENVFWSNFHDVLREDSEVSPLSDFKRTKTVFGEGCVGGIDSHS